jgi:pre-mRNA-splicing factor SYF1
LSLIATHERALVTQHKAPVIWGLYLKALTTHAPASLTRTRRAFDKALSALPLTQHARWVWPAYLAWASSPRGDIPAETAVRVYRRYVRFEPGHAEEFVAVLCAHARWGEAAAALAAALDDPSFVPLSGASRHALWLRLCDLAVTHAAAVGAALPVDAILAAGARGSPAEAGRLWAARADFHIRRGRYERARDVYEAGLNAVSTVRDFGLVYDTLAQFEESLAAHRLAALEKEGGEQEEAEGAAASAETYLLRPPPPADELDLRLARLEALASRRPALLSSVRLRQDPHAVPEWHRRARLFEGDPAGQVKAYTEAVRAVDPKKASGKPHTLWTGLAGVYEKAGDLENARRVLEAAVTPPAPSAAPSSGTHAASLAYADDLASLWCARIELELRAQQFRAALGLAREGTERAVEAASAARPVGGGGGGGALARLARSSRLWALRCDLEESLGSLDDARAAYEGALAAKAATPQMVLNFAALLTENKAFEAAFRAYEAGLAAFPAWPAAGDLWAAYLAAFEARHGGEGPGLARGRDLFKAATAAAPPAGKVQLFLKWAAFEAAHAPTARAALDVLAAARLAVPPPDRLAVVDAAAAAAAGAYGVGKVREVYESALEATGEVDGDGALPPAAARAVAVKYAALEARLGETARARGIYAHAAPLADPADGTPPDAAAAGEGSISGASFWAAWHAFEVSAGDEAAFRDMLRARRGVAASYSGAHAPTVAGAAAVGVRPPPPPQAARAPPPQAGGTMEELEAAATAAPPPLLPSGTRLPGFVSGGTVAPGAPPAAGLGPGVAGGTESKAGAARAAVGPEDIDLDDLLDAAPAPVADVAAPQTKAVPAGVFGGLGRVEEEEEGGEEPPAKRAR